MENAGMVNTPKITELANTGIYVANTGIYL